MSDSEDDSRSVAVGRKRKRQFEPVRESSVPTSRRSSMESGEISNSSESNSSHLQVVNRGNSSDPVGPPDPFKSYSSEVEPREGTLEASEGEHEAPAKTLGPCINQVSSEHSSSDDLDLSSSEHDSSSDESIENPDMKTDTPVTRRGERLLIGVTLAELPEDQQILQTRYFGIKNPAEYVRCFCCAGMGHNASECPERDCKHCGARNEHSASGCPTYRKCTHCRQRGHDSRDCDNMSHVQPGGPDDPCDICEQEGHYEDECPHLGDIYFQEQKARQRLGLIHRTGELKVMKSCYSCGDTTHDTNGHWGDDCPHATRWQRKLPTGSWNRKHASMYLLDSKKPEASQPGPASGLWQAAAFDDARD